MLTSLDEKEAVTHTLMAAGSQLAQTNVKAGISPRDIIV
jgi:hypothetical protein